MKTDKIELIEALEDLIVALELKRNKDDEGLLEIEDDDTQEELEDLFKKAIPMIVPKEDTLKLNTWKFVKLINPEFWQEHKKHIPKFEKVPEESLVEENILAPKGEEDEEVVDAFLPEIVKDDVVPDETPKELFIEDKFKNACPKITDEEFKALETLILKDGAIYDPIVVWDNTIVDGHNRYAIATKHNIPFRTEEKTFATEMDAIIWIKEHAISQRNLSDFSKYELVKDLEIMLGNIGKQKQKEKGVKKKSEEKHNTRKAVAKKANISATQIAKAKAIDKVADEETKQALREDKTTIGKVYKELKPVENSETKTGGEKARVGNAIRELNIWSKKYGKYSYLKDFAHQIKDIVIDLEILEKAF